MAYVDLNPIRATMAKTSDYTSVQERINPSFDLSEATKENSDINTHHFSRFTLKPLAPFDGNISSNPQNGIPFSFKDYLILVDTTGRIIRDDKRGFIPNTFEPILKRLNIDTNEWINNTQEFEKIYQRAFGRRRRIDKAA